MNGETQISELTPGAAVVNIPAVEKDERCRRRVRKSASWRHRGSPILNVRVHRKLLVRMEDAMDSANARANVSTGEPYDYTGWIVAAIEDKLKHLARARKASARKVKADHDGRNARTGHPVSPQREQHVEAEGEPVLCGAGG